MRSLRVVAGEGREPRDLKTHREWQEKMCQKGDREGSQRYRKETRRTWFNRKRERSSGQCQG